MENNPLLFKPRRNIKLWSEWFYWKNHTEGRYSVKKAITSFRYPGIVLDISADNGKLLILKQTDVVLYSRKTKKLTNLQKHNSSYNKVLINKTFIFQGQQEITLFSPAKKVPIRDIMKKINICPKIDTISNVVLLDPLKCFVTTLKGELFLVRIFPF